MRAPVLLLRLLAPPHRPSLVPLRLHHLLTALIVTGLSLAPSALSQATEPVPHWIWSPPPASGVSNVSDRTAATVWFRKVFRPPPYTWNARLTVAADDQAEIFLNGKPVAACLSWDQPLRAEVSMRLNHGDNVLAVRATNTSGPAGLLVHLNLGGSSPAQIVSDPSWLCSTRELPGWNLLDFPATDWQPVLSLGNHGRPPWGDLLSRAFATPAESLRLLPGFRAELLRSAAPDEGSWIASAFDSHGRLFLAPEGDGKPLLRLAFDPAGRVSRVDRLPAPIRFAMGLLFVGDTLYANAKGPEGTGLYRLDDTNHNDQFDENEWRLLKAFRGGGEHGYHGLVLGPDRHLYIINGNGTRLPDGLRPLSPYRHFAEDVPSLNPDETTRSGGALAPGCVVLRTDLDGRDWEVFCGGLRNAYAIDFNPQGDLFTWDSDNEWDWGMPWYRPTRLLHLVSGGEAGWRDGTRAWPDSYPDRMESVADLGIGSPTGVRFGTHARFPERYRRALFVQDWSYGRILAVHLEPRGASYRGTFEEFVRGQPLNLTSLDFGPEGALYFTTGGRGTQSGLYRVLAETPSLGPLPPLPPTSTESATAPDRDLRRQLERRHARSHPAAVDQAWPHLASTDPALRLAARVALESQPIPSWIDRVRSESQPAVAWHALLALARLGGPDLAPALIDTLDRFPIAKLDPDLRLVALRVLGLRLARHDPPSAPEITRLRSELDPLYPSTVWAENRELIRLLAVLGAPNLPRRTLDLIDQATWQEQQIHFISQLRRIPDGWTPADRRRFFQWWTRPRDHLPRPGSLLHWFHDVGRDPVDGAGYNRHLEAFRRDAIAALPESARSDLADLLDAPIAGATLVPAQPRAFVQEWTLADLLPHLDQASFGRHFERGRRAFIDTQCYACHRLGSTGGAVGPELAAVASKYGRRELLESLVDPSRVISEQYQNTRVFLKDGDDVTGRLVRESDSEIVIEIDPLTRQERSVPRTDIDEIRPSTVSPMPEGLLSILSRDEILDLLAFLESGGRPDAPAFNSPPGPNPQPPAPR